MNAQIDSDNDAVARMMAHCEELTAVSRAYLASQPPEIPCPLHPGALRRLSPKASEEASRRRGQPTAEYEACPDCAAEAKEKEMRERLRRDGVPANLLHATLDSWTPANKQAKEHLATVRSFLEGRRGFLVMLGDLGTGKTHLAVGAMRHFKRPVFRKQSTLLRMLRDTYNNREARNPIAECQEADLLVLDDVGISPGGRDEVPMLHEILDHRHGEQKPSIVTSNLTYSELCQFLGERMADRFLESAFMVLNFTGPSFRPQARSRYLKT